MAVDFAGATFGATSESAFCEAEKAFTGDHYSSWTSSEEAPQTIWIQLKEVGEELQFLTLRVAQNMLVAKHSVSKALRSFLVA